MNRRGNRESLSELIGKIKAKIPNIVLRSTFITGFPGETEEQFEELAEFAAEAKFLRLGCFAYSAEENTPAAEFDGQVDDETKQRRADIIMEHQQSVMADYCEAMIDSEIEVLVEGYSKRSRDDMFGRTQQNKVIVFPACNTQIGERVNVKVNRATSATLIGELVE